MNESLMSNVRAYASERQRQIAERPGAEKREQLEGRWPQVEMVLAAFEEMGIYLLDVSPSNIAFLD